MSEGLGTADSRCFGDVTGRSGDICIKNPTENLNRLYTSISNTNVNIRNTQSPNLPVIHYLTKFVCRQSSFRSRRSRDVR